MTRKDWIVSIYAGAAFGGVFWMALPVFTKLLGPTPLPPHTVMLTIAISVVVGTAGLVLFRMTSGTISRRSGMAIGIGGFVGLLVLAWFALW